MTQILTTMNSTSNLHYTVVEDIARNDIKSNRPQRVACTPIQYAEYLQLKQTLDKSMRADLHNAYVVFGDSAMIQHFQQFL